MESLILFTVTGFLAELVCGALGMGYGVTSTTLLLSLGLSPAAASAAVHAAECFVMGASAISHHKFGNIDKILFKKLAVPGVIGAVLGAYALSHLPGDRIKPYISAYLLLMGVLIVLKAVRNIAPKRVTTHVRPLGFFGALLDVIGGGGWGLVVTSNLVARGNHVREAVGSANAARFFVTVAASATFFMTMGLENITAIAGLAVGGVLAAPLAAWACKKIPVKPGMIAVGILVILLSLYNLGKILL